jgi:Domain of unknown function (DUF4872)/Butirosin biosynthesis protein H, N-terminal
VSGSFEHLHAAHCETGVTAALFRHAGLPVSEPMVFGIGSGLFFAHIPPVKIMGYPLTTFRCYPGRIFRAACRRLGVAFRHERFRDPKDGARTLDALLERNVPVGVQTNIHWLPYFPPEFRSQFNGHNLIVLSRDGASYRLSDPVLPEPVDCPADALENARFAKGALAPRGLLYYPVSVGAHRDWRRAIRAGIRSTIFQMRTPLPFVGLRGIRFLAARMRSWPRRYGNERKARLQLAFLIRMQEEVGTGGAGFRFMYAAFLEEASRMLENPALAEASSMMTAAGDLWREFAVAGGRMLKERDGGHETFETLARRLDTCAELETAVFRRLRTAV